MSLKKISKLAGHLSVGALIAMIPTGVSASTGKEAKAHADDPIAERVIRVQKNILDRATKFDDPGMTEADWEEVSQFRELPWSEWGNWGNWQRGRD